MADLSMHSLALKKGDKVMLLSGKDKGKSGKIIAVDRKRGLVTVEGVNVHIRHQRPRRQGQKGLKVQIPTPFNPSRAMVLCPSCGKPTRIAHMVNDAGRKVRRCKKCGVGF